MVYQQAVDAMVLFRRGTEVDWVGGCTYQKEIFAYLYGTFRAAVTMEKLVDQMGQVRQNGYLLGRTIAIFPKLEVLARGHPWISSLYEQLHEIGKE